MNTPMSMSNRVHRVLFLCTHNSARSILAEALATHLGQGRLQGYSAGSQPSGTVNPHALATLDRLGCRIDGLRSKSWEEFVGPDAVPMDLVITVCDNAAHEICPVWPGTPVPTHWGCPDPSSTRGGAHETARAFRRTAELIADRIQGLLALPLEAMDGASLGNALAAIAQHTRPAALEPVT
ncbi:arsenate reductase ArsC [Luteimonas salinilitoris]|uniref:Arsenate reductase ArsC n=1 Tax=Luteimonas salinilitoris TaxID=3237697 RepID=A0ABV4HSS0_9GAMM